MFLWHTSQLEPGLCSMLKSSQDVCHKNIDLCPMTCGICNVISSANCHDGILNNGCLSMYVTPGKCGDQLARFTCPKSCGYCDAIVSKKIQDLINIPKSNVVAKTTAPPPTTTTTTTTSTPVYSSQSVCASLVGELVVVVVVVV